MRFSPDHLFAAVAISVASCGLLYKPEVKPEEPFRTTAERIKAAHMHCKKNDGIKVIIGGPKDRTVCRNGAIFPYVEEKPKVKTSER